MEWYYTLGAIAYGFFIIQFILSWIGGDFEVDTDLEISDIVSFKGLIHFLMGYSSWLILRSKLGELIWTDYLFAALFGIVFVIILYYIYKSFLKLENKPKPLSNSELVGKSATVYISNGIDSDGFYNYIITCNNGIGFVELSAKSNKQYKTGDSVSIQSYLNNSYII